MCTLQYSIRERVQISKKTGNVHFLTVGVFRSIFPEILNTIRVQYAVSVIYHLVCPIRNAKIKLGHIEA